MNLQYVELDDSTHRHIVGKVLNGKNKKGAKQALTQCGQPFSVDDAIIFASPTSSLMGKEDARPPCPACNGKDEAPAPAPAPVTPLRLEQLDVDAIERSPLNHRTRFDGIEELGADIKVNGLRVPIKVRPWPADQARRSPKIQWQLVYGERRWRAAKSAAVATLPALIAELDDLAVIKEQLVENVSRADVHPLEEADGYHALLEQHGYTAEQIATETGKSKAYVYARLKLCALAPTARVEFFAGRLNASVALLIARIPDMGLQAQATNEVLGEVVELERYNPDSLLSKEKRTILVNEDPDLEEFDDDGNERPNPGRERQPMSVREAQLHLQRRYMLRLELAKFPIDDASLLPSAGACTTCEFRTGNQRELFADVSSADVCTKPSCFHDKTRLEGDRRAQAAEAKGATVVEGAKAKKVFDRTHGTKGLSDDISSASPYVDPRDSIPWGLRSTSAKSADTWEKALGKKLAEKVPTVVVRHPETGEARELLDKGAALKVLREAGKLPEPPKERTSPGVNWEIQAAKREKERAIRDRAVRELLVEAFATAGELGIDETKAEHLAWWRWAISAVMELARSSGLVTAKLLLDDETAGKGDVSGKLLDRFLTGCKNADVARGVMTTLLVEELAPYVLTDRSDRAELFEDGCKLLGIDFKKHVEAAKAAQKVADKAEAAVENAKDEKKAKAKPAKKASKK